MSFYAVIKDLHVACVLLSGAGFFVRGVLALTGSRLMERRWMRIVPHVNDAVLLAAAITLTMLIGHYPFLDAWLTAKVFGLIAYIGLGFLALKPGRSKAARAAAWVAALLVFSYIVSVALSKDARGPLALFQP